MKDLPVRTRNATADDQRFLLLCLAALIFGCAPLSSAAESRITVAQGPGLVRVTWPLSESETGSAVFSTDAEKPLIESLGIAAKGASIKEISRGLDPVTLLTVGERDLKNPAGWMAFFDNPPLRPYDTYLAKLGQRRFKVTTEGMRTTVSVADISAGSFHGDVRFTFYGHSPLIHVASVVTTYDDGRAIIYDTGLMSTAPDWKAFVWNDTAGNLQRTKVDPQAAAVPLAVAGRTLVAEGGNGSIAVFPPPHQFFYPLDEAYNLKFVWHGRNYRDLARECAFGIRKSPSGDKRFVPWFNAPPGTEQHLSVFYLLTSGDGRRAIDEVT